MLGLIFILVLSKCIKPYFKKKLVNNFSIVEDMIMYNFIFFIFPLIYYIFYEKNTITNIVNKLDINNSKIIFIYLGMITFEMIVSNNLIKNNDITILKNISRGLNVILTPIVGYFLFNNKISFNTIIGSFFIMIGIYIING